MLPNPPSSSSSRSSFTSTRLQPILPHLQRNALGSHTADYKPGAGPSKARRIDRACDACRRKKTKCDGPWAQDSVCTNCIQAKKACTYIEASKPRGPPKAYVVGLEDRIEELESLLAQIRPGVDFSNELGPPVIRDSWKNRGGEERQAKKKRTADTKLLAESPEDAQIFPQTSSCSSSSPTSLPPLIIPFHQDAPQGAPSPTTRTTHLLFNPRTKAKKRRSKVASAESAERKSSGSPGSSSTAPEYRSLSSFTSPSDSTSDSAGEASDSDSEEIVETSLAGRNRIALKMNETPHAANNKIVFHGRSTTAGLVEATRRFKHLHMQETMQMEVEAPQVANPDSERPHSEPSASGGEPRTKVKFEGPDNANVASTRRPQFWRTPPWECGPDGADPSSSPRAVSTNVLDRFPPEDLCAELIDTYFVYCNSHFPLLHQPTFKQQWKDRLHHTNFWFAAKCLLLFAVASRWSKDERVVPKPEDRHPPDQFPPWRPQNESNMDGMVRDDDRSSEEPVQTQHDSHAKRWWYAGMTYADAATEVIRANANLNHGVSLFEVQALALLGQYLRTTTGYPQAWIIVSIGLRRAIDAGAHRMRVYKSTPSAEGELWKRAFWHLVVFDRLGGVVLGRSVGIGEEDFDLEFPLEVDDPYWGDEYGWKQPAGVPCTISFFNHFIKLTQIVAFTSRTIYAINKNNLFTGLIKGDWRNEVLTQLNAALEECIEGVPTHLRWSKDISDPLFYSLSATFITTYYLTRLLIYRPFIPPPPLLPQSLRERNPPSGNASSSIAFPALAICISSARACTRVLEHQYSMRSWEMMHVPNFYNAAYVCAGIFLLAFWDLKGQQKALVKIQLSGVIDSPTRVGGGQDQDSSQEKEKQPPGAGDAAEGLGTEQILRSLKEKMEELLADARLLIEALEWVEPRWQCVSPWIAQLKQSMPQEEDLKEWTPPPQKTSAATASRKESFQDLRKQRQQQQKRKQKADSPDERLARHESSHSSLPPLCSTSSQQSVRPLKDGEPPDPTLFIPENYAHLHTFQDEDLDDLYELGISPPKAEHGPPIDLHGASPSRPYVEQPHHARPSPYSLSPTSPMLHVSRSMDNIPQHHDHFSRTSHALEDGMSRPHQLGMYGQGEYAHPDNSALPFISSTVRRPSFSHPRISLNHRRDSLPPPPPPSHRTLAERTPSFDDVRSARFQPPIPGTSRSSISMDRSTLDEDAKPPISLPSFEFPPQRYRDDRDSGLAHNADRRYRRADVRVDGPSAYPRTFPPEVGLRHAWSAQDGQPQQHPVIQPPYHSAPLPWEHNPTYHHPHEPGAQPAQFGHPLGFAPHQHSAPPDDSQRSMYQSHTDASLYGRTSRPGPFDHTGYGHVP